jgi:hypothetical protein
VASLRTLGRQGNNLNREAQRSPEFPLRMQALVLTKLTLTVKRVDRAARLAHSQREHTQWWKGSRGRDNVGNGTDRGWKKGFISGSLKDRKVEAKHTCKASNFLLPYDYLGICFSAHPIPLFHSF